MPGYHIEWKHSNKVTKTSKTENPQQELTVHNEQQKDEKTLSIHEETPLNQQNEVAPKLLEQKTEQDLVNKTLSDFNQEKYSRKTITTPIKSDYIRIQKAKNKQEKNIKPPKAFEEVGDSGINLWALLSLICAVIAIVFSAIAILVTLTFGLTGFIFGIKGLREINSEDPRNFLSKLFAILGIVLNGLILLFFLIALIILMIVIILLF
jgi:hypothetical protein